jgi:hypothetical protein
MNLELLTLTKILNFQFFSFIIRGGNRPGRSTGAYGLAYLKPSSAQLVYYQRQAQAFYKAYLIKQARLRLAKKPIKPIWPTY